MTQLRPPLWRELQPSQLLAALGDPPDRYRPVPWLAWTGDLDWPALREQLTEMLDKGITEFFLFPIYGMELPYMSAAYWERVQQTLEFCRERGMKCWIYDEYNWPSGVCAGAVLRDHPEAREKLLWLGAEDAAAEGMPPGVSELQHSGGVAWAVAPGAGLRINVRGCDWLSAIPGYLDVLSPEACRRFIEYTHDRYLKQAPDMFPATIPGFFTDEPGFHARAAGGWFGLPFTDDLLADFEARYGYDLTDRLADLLSDRPGAARTRCHYWRLVAERFGQAYAAQQRAWCDGRGVALTGHCLGEEALAGHVRMSGDLWEPLRHFTIPGIDMLANADGFTYPHRTDFYGEVDRRAFHLTCKLVHGVVRHAGAREMLSEAYGVCDWGMSLFRQKRGFNYQVALGVTLFNDNSLVTSIADFRKYAIAGKHFTQPWWRHYREYADYNARLAALHAEGEPIAQVAVLFPRSTMWARTDAQVLEGPWRGPAQDHPLHHLQELIYDLLDELIREQWHFDFIFEPVLAEATVDGADLVAEHARYRALIVPSATDLPEECADVLRAFAAAGGLLIFAGDLPAREVDTQADLAGAAQEILAGDRAFHLPASGVAVCEAFEQHLSRPLVLSGDGAREFVSSWRRLAGADILFVANMAEQATEVQVTVNLDGPLLICDPDTLECYRPAPAGDGALSWHFDPWQAFLIIVGEAADAAAEDLPAAPAWLAPARSEELAGAWHFSLEPGNMLRLSLQVRPDPENRGAAEGWQHDRGDEGWITPDGDRLPEPILPGESPWYWLRSRVVCRAGAEPRRLVCDSPDFLEAYVNGRPADQLSADPIWAEENFCFDVSGLFAEGESLIHLRARTSKYNAPRIAPMPGIAQLLQPVVLVGDFLCDRLRSPEGDRLLPWPGQVRADAPWEAQGLPHFAGTGVYRRTFTWDGRGRALLHLLACRDSVEVRLNGEPCGVRAWPPYLFDLTDALREGDNDLEVRVHNTLGNVILATYGGRSPLQPPTSGLTAPPRLLTI